MKCIHQSFQIEPDDHAANILKVERAARTCYASLDKIGDGSAEKLIRNLIARGHESPLEFGDMTVRITTSRAVLAELTRHRLSSFCVESQRYVNYKQGVTFIYPEWFIPASHYVDLGDDKVSKSEKQYYMMSRTWSDYMFDCEEAYQDMILNGARPEEAREILPNSTACNLMMKANYRQWRHIFQLRTASGVYPQMRSLMTGLLEAASKEIPYVFDDLK